MNCIQTGPRTSTEVGTEMGLTVREVGRQQDVRKVPMRLVRGIWSRIVIQDMMKGDGYSGTGVCGGVQDHRPADERRVPPLWRRGTHTRCQGTSPPDPEPVMTTYQKLHSACPATNNYVYHSLDI